jgi:hypothetical protein
MNLPERINASWLGTLTDTDLVNVEAQLHGRFMALEKREKVLRGAKYNLVMGPPDLMDAWDRWCRVNTATTVRQLVPRRR